MAYQPKRIWLDKDVVFIPGKQLKLPKNLEKWIPKFNPDERYLVEDHIKTFMQSVSLRNAVHEYVVCRLFLYSFEGKSSTWYFSLEARSIKSWDDFEAPFLQNFGDDSTHEDLVMDLSFLRIKGNERVKYFNQRFNLSWFLKITLQLIGIHVKTCD